VAKRVARTGAEVTFLRTDVRRRADLSALVAQACERFGRLDVLVNNLSTGTLDER
jgi:NAD(P)-dependent dehydrogenase (short-subunit alcohol dehydrogenase family)